MPHRQLIGPGGTSDLGGWLQWLARLLLKPRSRGFRIIFAAAAVLIASGLRHVLDGSLPPGFPFLTFFPAVLLTTVFAGTAAGSAAAVLCGLAAWFWFIPPAGAFSLAPGALVAMAFYAAITTTEIVFISATNLALRALVRAEGRAREQARQRELMFSELQHRVSNNLSTVAALLRMQAGRTRDAEAKGALQDAQQRIATVARLQRLLHAPDSQTVDAVDFLKSLSRETVEAAGSGQPVDVRLEADPVTLSEAAAVPFGLIASELLMNAIEHGAAGSATPQIDIRLRLTQEAQPLASLDIGDNGPGLPQGFSVETSRSLGLSIARQFAEQLGGTLALTNRAGGGTLSRLTFPMGAPA